MNRITDTVKHLIIINIIFYVAKLALKQYNLDQILDLYYWENPNYKPLQFITYMFMHDGRSFTHLLFNMVGLFFLGPPMEQIWGKQKFIFAYFSAGIGAALIYSTYNYFQFQDVVQSLSNTGMSKIEILDMFKQGRYIPSIPISEKGAMILNTPMLGASGAIFGLLAAFGWYFPNAKVYLYFLVPVPVKYFVPFIIIADLISGLTGIPLMSPNGTAYFAHVGGAVIGFLIAYIWKKNQFRTY